ncbi:hypothetical protein ABBQ38_010409 [Trebouxia sp. C0009 RCD-2024]
MDETDSLFQAAADHVETHVSELNDEQRLRVYGLYKQATCGPCATAKPSFINFKGRAKWSAWSSNGTLSQGHARQQYVELVAQCCPKWQPDCGDNIQQGGPAGPVFSSLAHSKECTEDLDAAVPEGSLHIRASVDDASGVEQMLKTGAQVDQRDDQGCTPLHWAADRGSQQVIKTLLAHGADVNAADIDGQTPLQYAWLCDNQQVYAQLVQAGAHPLQSA